MVKGRKGWLLVYILMFGISWLASGFMLTVLTGGWLVYSCVEWVAMTIVFGTMFNDRDTAIGANQVWLVYVIVTNIVLLQEAGVLPSIGAAIWIWYWAVSKRVKATYLPIDEENDDV